jgi:hypothetical protein
MTLVASVALAFGLGWLTATLTGGGTTPATVPAPATSTAPAAPTPETSTPVTRVGFAQPTVTAHGLEIMSVLTKIKGGVDVTLLVQNQGNAPITVDTASLGPHDLTFRGQTVPIEMAVLTKKLSPGESLVYPCRVRLPDMNIGELSFVVGGVPVSGPAAGD